MLTIPHVARSFFVTAGASLLLLGALPNFASAQTTVSITPSRDNSIYEESTNSNGIGDVFIGNNAGGNARRGLLFYDIASSVPVGSIITGVQFDYFVVAPSGRPASLVNFHRSLADWGEAGSSGRGQGGPAQTNDATWQHAFFSGTNWATAGGDFVAAPSDSFLIGSFGAATEVLPGLTNDVQFFLDNPTSNFGWFLIGDETTNASARRILSREDTSGQPTLQVTFTAAVPALLGDVNLDGMVTFLDIAPFVAVLSADGFQAEADLDQNGIVNFLDIGPFIDVLSS